MRIKELHLSRYGHFTDFELDFGNNTNTTNDLHLVYGENEAGKSTTLSAIVDLLYGISHKTDYNFIHNNKTMEVGATLEQSGELISLRRLKTKLTDQNQQPLPASTIDTHGLSREEFQSRFSFDETTLKKGGEAILGNNGDLGTALFSATSGISDFTAALEEQMKPANIFYEKGKVKDKRLFEIKDKLKEIDAKRKDLDVNATHWAKQESLAQELNENYTTYKNEADERKTQLEKLNRQHQALSVVARYNALKTNIESQPVLPKVPSNWQNDAKPLITQQLQIQSKLVQLAKQTSSLKADKSNLSIDQDLLTHAPSIDNLQKARNVFDQRVLDLNEQKLSLSTLQDENTKLLGQLSLPSKTKSKNVLLAQVQIDDIRTHIQTHGQQNTALTIAEKETKDISLELEQLETDESAKPVNTDKLENYLAIVRDSANGVKLSQIEEQLTEQTNSLDLQLTKLSPWQGEIDQLISQTAPSKALLQELEDYLSNTTSAIDIRKASIKTIKKEIKALHDQSNQTSKRDQQQSIKKTREQRDKAWTRHLDSIDTQAKKADTQKSAREYALTQQKLDSVTDAELLVAAQQGALNASTDRQQKLEETLKSEQDTLSDLKAELKSFKTKLDTVCHSLQIDQYLSPKELIDWLDLREVIVESEYRRQKLAGDLKNVSNTLNKESKRLKTLTIAVNPSTSTQLEDISSPDEVIALAQSTLTKQKKINTELEQKNSNLLSLQTRQKKRQSELSALQANFDTWSTTWAQLLDATWITERTVDGVTPILNTLEKLLQLEEKLITQKSAIEQLESLQTQFETDANKLLDSLGRSEPQALDQKLNTLFADTQKSLEDKTVEARLDDRLQGAESEVNELQTTLLPITNTLGTMLKSCDATDVTDLETTLEKIKEQTTQHAQLAELEQSLVEILRADSAETALSSLTELNEHALTSAISELNLDVERDTKKLEELRYAYLSTQDELEKFNSNAEVAQLGQERTNLLIELEDQAMQTMRLRLGKLAIEQGIRHFREQHRSSMLENARKAFIAITCGNYVDLTTQLSDKKNNSEELIGIKASGQSTLAANMSTGTRAQLYLALRIAAYQDYCKTREPLPFVADDIMESFDEQRTEATLLLLNEMAMKGQIIYLTHHRHVLDIAKSTLGKNVNIHELPRRKPTLSVVKNDN